MKKISQLPTSQVPGFTATQRLSLLTRLIQRCEQHTRTHTAADAIEMSLCGDASGLNLYFGDSGLGPTINGISVNFALCEVSVGNHLGRLLSLSYPPGTEPNELIERLFKTVLDYFNPPAPKPSNQAELVPLVIAAVFEKLKSWAEPPRLDITTSYRNALNAKLLLQCTLGPRQGAWSALDCDTNGQVYLRSGLAQGSESHFSLPLNVNQTTEAVIADFAGALLANFLIPSK